MQQALSATGHPIVLSVEGWEDVRVLSKGGHGQTKRVGHDIGDNPLRPWYSIVSEIDLSSGLWPYAHNASSDKGDGNGFWNDMDILEVGVSNRPEFTPEPRELMVVGTAWPQVGDAQEPDLVGQRPVHHVQCHTWRAVEQGGIGDLAG